MMVWTPTLVAVLLMSAVVVVLVPGAAADCAERVTGYGGVVGATEAFAVDTANSACEPDVDPATYTDGFCVYLWGVDCAGIPQQAVDTLNYECRWLTDEDCI